MRGSIKRRGKPWLGRVDVDVDPATESEGFPCLLTRGRRPPGAGVCYFRLRLAFWVSTREVTNGGIGL